MALDGLPSVAWTQPYPAEVGVVTHALNRIATTRQSPGSWALVPGKRGSFWFKIEMAADRRMLSRDPPPLRINWGSCQTGPRKVAEVVKTPAGMAGVGNADEGEMVIGAGGVPYPQVRHIAGDEPHALYRAAALESEPFSQGKRIQTGGGRTQMELPGTNSVVVA